MSRDTFLQICITGISVCPLAMLWRVIDAWPTLGWGRTTGVVEKAWLAEEQDAMGDDMRDTGTHMVLNVLYTYVVRGKICRCSRVWFKEPIFISKRGLEAEVARYAPGTIVPVYYSRWRPDGNAVLRRRTIGWWFTLSCALAAIGCFLVGAVASNDALREAATLCLNGMGECRTAIAPLLASWFGPATDGP